MSVSHCLSCCFTVLYSEMHALGYRQARERPATTVCTLTATTTTTFDANFYSFSITGGPQKWITTAWLFTARIPILSSNQQHESSILQDAIVHFYRCQCLWYLVKSRTHNYIKTTQFNYDIKITSEKGWNIHEIHTYNPYNHSIKTVKCIIRER